MRFAVLLFSVVTSLAGAHPASGSPYQAAVALSGSAASEGHPLVAAIDFGGGFTSVDRVCFTVTFAGDFLDPGDSLVFTPLSVLPSLGGIGIANVGQVPESQRTICTAAALNDVDSRVLAAFLDGREDVELGMLSGSATVSSLTVALDGARGFGRVSFTFTSETGRVVTWEGEVTSGRVAFARRPDGLVGSMSATSTFTGGAFSVDLNASGVGRLLSGSVSARRGNQRMSIRRAAGIATGDGVRFGAGATYFDGRNTLFGSLVVRFIEPV